MALLSRPVVVDELVTREGDPLVVAHLELTSPDPAALTAALDEVHQRSAEESDPVAGPEIT